METKNSKSASRPSFGGISSAKKDRNSYAPSSSPKPKQESTSDAGGGGDAASDGESAGAVETKGARLVRELRQRAGAGSLVLAPAAPCGGRPRQLDTALAQERVVLQNALANAVGFVDQARDEIMNWLDRRETIPRARPSINEIREINEISIDNATSNLQSTENQNGGNTWSSNNVTLQESQKDECTVPRNTRVRFSSKDSASVQRDEKIESQDSNNGEYERQKCRNEVAEQGSPSKGNKSQTHKLRTLKKSASLIKREVPQAKWESNLPRNRISNTMLHTELSICEMNAKIRPSIGFYDHFLKKKSLSEIYGSTNTRTTVRKTSLKVKKKNLGVEDPIFYGAINSTTATGIQVNPSNKTNSHNRTVAACPSPRSQYPQTAKPDKFNVAPSRQVRTITSGVKKMTLGSTRAVEFSSPGSEAHANRRKLGISTTVTHRRADGAVQHSKCCKRQCAVCRDLHEKEGIGSNHKNSPKLPPINN